MHKREIGVVQVLQFITASHHSEQCMGLHTGVVLAFEMNHGAEQGFLDINRVVELEYQAILGVHELESHFVARQGDFFHFY